MNMLPSEKAVARALRLLAIVIQRRPRDRPRLAGVLAAMLRRCGNQEPNGSAKGAPSPESLRVRPVTGPRRWADPG